ncbi:hypothetical protein ADJ77_08735 [Prevotella fusca JCM 17724]|uniref:Uncharacterized protein n=1 Tax=Prevotella fusca JCM 17724 TaxID=1236517 RepID=A0A0K1NLG6_9BACT|nr:hypothetical protein ADJ77_08735 [Prevotella fusca JCM 17724]
MLCFLCEYAISFGSVENRGVWFSRKQVRDFIASSVKCVDTFRIALKDEPSLFIKQNIAKTVLATYFIIILRCRKPFHVNASKIADNSLKNHDIISDKISTDKGKNTCKKQVCNQQ